MSEATYLEYRPAAALRPYVGCYWTSVGPAEEAPRRVLPDGCMDVVFHLGGERPHVDLVGAMTRPLLFEAVDPVAIVAVRFLPGGAAPFLQVRADELTDVTVEAPGGWGLDLMLEAGCAAAGVRRLEAELLRRLAAAGEPDLRVRAACLALEQVGADVAKTAEIVGLSRQQLNRLFRREVGVGPKLFARVKRMERVLALARGGESWVSAALGAGYFDQSHWARDCRLLAGATPEWVLGGK